MKRQNTFLLLLTMLLTLAMAGCGGDDSGSSGGSMADKAADSAEEVAEAAADGADAAGDMAEEAGEAAADMAGKAGDMAADASDAMKEAGSNAADMAKEAGDSAMDMADEAMGDAKEMAGKAADEAMDMANEAGDAAAGAVAGAMGKAAEVANVAEGCGMEISAGDTIAYSSNEMTAPAGCEAVTVTLTHTGQFPKEAMGHNWVLIPTEALDEVANASMGVGVAGNYVPDDDRIIAATKLVGGGESTSVSFSLEGLAGTYSYICTFPGHWAVMRGTFTVGG